MPALSTPPHSLTTRVAVLTLVLLLAGMWSLAWYADHRLRADVREQLQAQQQTLAGVLAREVHSALHERASALQAAARGLSNLPGSPQARLMQSGLQRLAVVQQAFSGGYYVTDATGEVVASFPPQLGPRRRAEPVSATVRAALAGGTAIGSPGPGLVEDVPVLEIATPLAASEPGGAAGALVGVLRLRDDSLLHPLPSAGRQIAYECIVVDRPSRSIVAASAPERVFTALPEPGVDGAVDGLLAGGGTAVQRGGAQPMLASSSALDEPPWSVVVSQPLAQALAPLDAMRRALLTAALVLTLLAAGGVWWMLRRALRPLQEMGLQLADMAREGASLQPLPPQRARELAQLVHGTNHLLAQLGQRQRALLETQALYRTAFFLSPDALDITRVRDGQHLDVNAGFERLFGWSRAEALGHSALELRIWAAHDAPERERFVRQVLAEGGVSGWEQQLWRRDGSPVAVVMSARLLDVQGEPCMLWISHDVTARREADAHIRRLTSTDVLTGLPNVQQLMQMLEQAQSRCADTGSLGALLCLNLDDFKTVNDSLGRMHGDQLLQQVGRRISAALGADGAVARLAGDEFLVLLPDLPAPLGVAAHAAEAAAQRIAALLAQPLGVEGTTHSVSACVGIQMLGERHQEPSELLRQATLALNQAKANGPGAMLFFEPQMQDQVSSRARLQRHLREALRLQSFALHYQPQVDETGAVVGVEALVRWPLRGQGMVPPSEFIPLAEKTGLIVPLGRWILHAACRQLAQWAREPSRQHLEMSVNVSAGQFRQGDFVEVVREALAQTGAPPGRLKFELTESLMTHDIEAVAARMQALRAQGLRFSLDDFGTGFSSLAYLKRLPLQQLKIDQGFVRGMLDDHNDATIARTVIALGASLGLEVIAEGVETQAQRDALMRWGCRRFQGYWFSRPLPANALEAFLQERRAAPSP